MFGRLFKPILLSNAVASVFARSFPFEAQLKSSLVLDRGVGSPTFTRATIATVVDHEGLVKNVLSGEARFQGARRVRNIISVTSENFSNAAWNPINGGTGSAPTVTAGFTDPLGGTGAYRVQADRGASATGADYSSIRNTFSGGAGANMSNVHSIWIKSNTGSTQTVSLQMSTSVTNVTATTSWRRVGCAPIAYTNFDIGTIGNLATTASIDVLVWRAQSEDTVGQAIQAPSEYVSIGVLSSPWHGAGVDSVKYFTTANGNTLSGGVVTEATGAAIPDATLKGYLAEGARTNLALQSQAFGTSWITTNASIGTDAEVAPDGTTTADKLKNNGISNPHYLFLSTNGTAGVTYTNSVYAKQAELRYLAVNITDEVSGGVYAYFDLQSGVISQAVTNGGAWTGGTASITSVGSGWYRCAVSGVLGAAKVKATPVYVLSDTATGGETKIFTGTANDGVYLWGAQLEAGSFASSYIPTTTGSVPRNADVLTYPTASNVIGTVGTAYAEIAGQNIAIATRTIDLGNNRPALYVSIGPTISIYDGTTEANSPGFTASANIQKIASYWTGSTMRCVNGGSLGTAAAFDGDMNLGATLAIGVSNAGASQLFGTIRNVRIAQVALSDLTLQRITA